MSDWIKHDGGPQPVADDVWVEVLVAKGPHCDVSVFSDGNADLMDWPHVTEYEVLNQHLIDAAILEGIRLGLEAAAREAEERHVISAYSLRALDPATIAKDAKPPA